jgi:hypothetical protein
MCLLSSFELKRFKFYYYKNGCLDYIAQITKESTIFINDLIKYPKQ